MRPLALGASLRAGAVITGRDVQPSPPDAATARPGALPPVVGSHVRQHLSQALAEWIAAAKAYAQSLRPPAPRSAFRSTYEAQQARCAQFGSALALAQSLDAMVAVMVRRRPGQEGAVSDEMFLAATSRLQSARRAYFALRDRLREVEVAEATRPAAVVAVIVEAGRVRAVLSDGPLVATLVDGGNAGPAHAADFPVEVAPARARAWRECVVPASTTSA